MGASHIKYIIEDNIESFKKLSTSIVFLLLTSFIKIPQQIAKIIIASGFPSIINLGKFKRSRPKGSIDSWIFNLFELSKFNSETKSGLTGKLIWLEINSENVIANVVDNTYKIKVMGTIFFNFVFVLNEAIENDIDIKITKGTINLRISRNNFPKNSDSTIILGKKNEHGIAKRNPIDRKSVV